jgi:hypothetical protein
VEVYKRQYGYEDFGRTNTLVITATTLNFPFFLKQSFEDMGIYTDTENPVFEVIDLKGIWNTSNDGSGQKPCLNLNNCNVAITETPISFFGNNNGGLSAVVSTCPTPQTVQWSGPNGYTSTNLNISGLISGNYSLKITDASCDVTYVSYFLQQPQGLSFNVSTTNSQINDVNGTCNGSASVNVQGGQPPYTYSWYSGTTSFGTTSGLTNLCAGLYTVMITDASGTIVSSIFNITEPSVLSGSVITTTNIACNGGSTGSITVLGQGGYLTTGYTYNMTGPVTASNTTGNFINLPAGSYTVQISDNAVSTFNLPVVLTQPLNVSSSLSVPSSSIIGCFGSASGSLTVYPTGGNGIYNVQLVQTAPTSGIINTFSTPPYTFTDLDVGNYTVNIWDSTNCYATPATFTFTQRPLLNISYTQPTPVNGYDIACFGDTVVVPFATTHTSGSFTSPIVASLIKYYVDGILSATCTTTPPSCGVNLNLTAGVHDITVVDAANCSATTIVTLSQPAEPLTIVDLDFIYVPDAACLGSCPGNCKQAITNIFGGVSGYSITYIDNLSITHGGGIASNPFCDNLMTSMTVTVTDANGCQQIMTKNI